MLAYLLYRARGRLRVNKSIINEAAARTSNIISNGNSGTAVGDGFSVDSDKGVSVGLSVGAGVAVGAVVGCAVAVGVGVGVVRVTVQLKVDTNPAAFWSCA